MRLTVKEDAVRFEVHVRPRANKSEFTGVREGRLDVSLAAPPVDGAANDELIATVAKTLGIPKRQVALIRGETGRNKLLEVRGVPEGQIRALLSSAMGSAGR